MDRPVLKINDKTILVMGAVTLYGFALLSFIIIFIFAPNVNYFDLVFRGAPLFMQIIHGLIFGTAAFFIVNVFMKTQLLGDLTGMVHQLAKKMNWVQIFFISFCAGFGEELLFRVALQYFFGIWPTAIFFVMIHGYLSLSDWRVFSYGVIMTIISAGFGYIYFEYGIAASMMAHFLIDLIILGVLKTTEIKLPEKS